MMVFAVTVAVATGAATGTGFFAAGNTIGAANTFLAFFLGTHHKKYDRSKNQHNTGNQKIINGFHRLTSFRSEHTPV